MDKYISIFDKENASKFFSINCYYKTIYRNYEMCTHFHKRLEIMYVNYGEVEIEYFDSKSPFSPTPEIPSHLTLLSHEYVLIDLNVPHTIRVPDTPTQILNLELEPTVPINDLPLNLNLLSKSDENFKRMCQNLNRGKVFKLFDQNDVYSQLVLIQNDLNKKNPEGFDNTFTQFALAVLFTQIAADYTEQKLGSSGIETIYVKRALQYIDIYHQNKITNEQIAAHVGISQNYLNILFNRQFGKTINEYLNYYRINKAKTLIATSTLNFLQISEQVGFKTKQNFNKNFIKFIGLTPKQYRKRIHTITEIHWEKTSNNSVFLEDPENKESE